MENKKAGPGWKVRAPRALPKKDRYIATGVGSGKVTVVRISSSEPNIADF